MGYEREQGEGFAVGASGAAQDLAVDGEVLDLGRVLLEEPAGGDRFEMCGVDEVEHAEKGGVAGNVVVLFFAVVVATQGAALALGEFFANILVGLVAAGAHECGHDGAGERAGEAVVEAVAAFARVFELTQAFVEAAEFGGAEGAGAGDVGFGLAEGLGQAGTAKDFAGVGAEFAQVELLGLVVGGVVVARVAGKPGAGAHGIESAGAVAGAFVAGFIDETFHDEDFVSPVFLPIAGETAQGQAEDFGGEVGMALAFYEQEEAAVVADESEAAGLLARTPSDPLLAAFELRGRAAECEQRHPLAVHFGDVAQVAPADARAFEVMAGFKQVVEPLALGSLEQAQSDPPEIISGNGVDLHAPNLEKIRRDV